MTETKGLGRRITRLLNDLRNRRRYWELKEEAGDQEGRNDGLSYERKFHKPANKQNASW
jgi:hypothetical protein